MYALHTGIYFLVALNTTYCLINEMICEINPIMCIVVRFVFYLNYFSAGELAISFSISFFLSAVDLAISFLWVRYLQK